MFPLAPRDLARGVSHVRLPKPLRTYLQRERPRAVLVGMWPLTALVILVARTLRRRPRVVAASTTRCRNRRVIMGGSRRSCCGGQFVSYIRSLTELSQCPRGWRRTSVTWEVGGWSL